VGWFHLVGDRPSLINDCSRCI